MQRWSEDVTVKFVKKYLQHECLWNVQNLSYRNKQMKKLACVDIAKMMNLPHFGEKEVKMKIKSLRSTYIQERKKINGSQKYAGSPCFKTSLKWFQMMDNCLSTFTPIKQEIEDEPIQPYHIELHDNKLLDSEPEANSQSNYVPINFEDDQYFNNKHSIESDLEEDQLFEDEEFTPSPTKKKKFVEPSSDINKEVPAPSNNSNIETKNNLEYEVFGQLLAIQLGSLPPLIALQAQEHIQTYMNQLRRKHLQNYYGADS